MYTSYKPRLSIPSGCQTQLCSLRLPLQKDAPVLFGHPICMAGFGEVCSQITTTMFAMESAVVHVKSRQLFLTEKLFLPEAVPLILHALRESVNLHHVDKTEHLQYLPNKKPQLV